jgi:hypothetical protein
MRTIAITLLSAYTLLCPALAFAGGGGPVSPPAVGAAAPPQPESGAEVGVPHDAKSVPGAALEAGANGAAEPATSPTHQAIDISTAAPGGHAESSRNGALSTPPDITKPAKHHKKGDAAGS